MVKVVTPAPSLVKPKTKPSRGKFDGDNPGPAGKFKRTKGSGPAEKIYDIP